MTTLLDFGELLKRRMGLDSASIGEAAVERAVRLRMQACAVSELDAYWLRVMSSEEEMQQLVESVVVPETWFFRYPESLQALAQLAREREGALRILSLPCSTGEEPYSIAMALLDIGRDPASFSIDALDISARALAVARQAIYGRNAFRGGDQAFRLRYFDAEGQLDAQVRNCVRFSAGNIFDPGLLSAMPPYDFVFCRNLLIYFDAATQNRALAVLTRLTRRDGVIFVGPAEANLLTSRGHRSIKGTRSFAFSAAAQRPAATPPAEPQVRRAPIRQPEPANRIAFKPLFKEPLTTNAEPLAAAPSTPDNSLTRVAELADQGRLTEAWEASEAHIARFGPSAQIWYLRGLVQDATGRLELAREAYRKALYLDPAHRQALLQLAALLQAAGQAEEARRLQARAARGGSHA